MRPAVSLSLLTICLALGAATGANGADPQMLAAQEHASWQAIGRLNAAGYRNRQMCSATLIDAVHVLTAAHCVLADDGQPIPAEDLHFVAGWFRGERAADASVALIRLLPKGGFPSMQGWDRIAADMALLRLATPIEGVRPIPAGQAQGLSGLRILGYRWDRPHALSDSGDCPALPGPPHVLLLDCPVTFGTSGAPVLQAQGDGGDRGWRVVAIVSATSRDFTASAPVPQGGLPLQGDEP